jgi:HK97 family phage prohead protease
MPIDMRPLYLRATWTTAFVNDLPDSSFLYIAPGGSKDSDGKTQPRSLRYFPVKDASGKVDEPHLANALARIPQASTLSAEVRAKAMNAAKALAKKSNVSGPKGTYQGDAGSGRSRSSPTRESLPAEWMGSQERTFDLIMELRDTGDGRTLYGRAVPYNVIGDLGKYQERFMPGVFARQVGSQQFGQIKLYDAHTQRLDGRHPIGKTVNLSEQPDGLYGEWRVHDTSAGNDALHLVRAGEVTGLSVGFRAQGGGSRRGDDGVLNRISAHLDHVALTHEPVYQDAQVLGVRSQEVLARLDNEREALRAVLL